MCLECDGLGERFSFDPELADPRSEPLGRSRRAASSCWAPGPTWAAGGGTSIKAWPTRWSANSACPPASMLETPWEELDPEAAGLCAVGHRRRAHHVHLARRRVADQVRRQVRGHHPRPAVPLPQRQEPPAPAAAGKVHEYLALRRMPRPPAEPAGAGGQGDDGGSPVPQTAASCRCRKSASCRSATRPIFSASWSWTTLAQLIAAEVLKEIRGRLGFLLNVGLDYLTLDRTAPTLSGGESQRIRLAGQIGCGLVGVLYILDEPSIGLHPRDNDRCWRRCSGCATWATRWSSSSTTKTRCGPPTTSSTSAPAPACAAAKSSLAGTLRGGPEDGTQRDRPIPVRPAGDRRAAAAPAARRSAAAQSSARRTTT